jgi:hypothetical protein
MGSAKIRRCLPGRDFRLHPYQGPIDWRKAYLGKFTQTRVKLGLSFVSHRSLIQFSVGGRRAQAPACGVPRAVIAAPLK